MLETDPNPRHWNGGKYHGITRRSAWGMVVLTVALILLLLPLVQFTFALFAPIPFEYRNLPFKVCSLTRSTPTTCAEVTDDDVFHGGDVVPFVVDRCATDPFARSAVLPYVVSRNVVNDLNGTRIILPSLSTEIPTGGCSQSVTMAHQLPDTLAPGTYYLEGVATVYGRFRIVNAYFRTETFIVAKRGEQ